MGAFSKCADERGKGMFGSGRHGKIHLFFKRSIIKALSYGMVRLGEKHP